MFSHHSSVLDREEEGELVTSLHRDLARRAGSRDLGHSDHLVPGVDQLHRDDVVAGQRLLVLLEDQTDGLLAVVGPQEEGLEDRVFVIDLGQSIEVSLVVRGEAGPDQF